MSRAATVPPTKKLIILRGATDFPGPRKGAARPTDSTISNHFLLRSRQRSIVNDPFVLYGLPPRRFHSTNRSRASLPANNRYVRGLFSPLLLTSSRFVLPSFPFSLSFSLICIDRGLDAFPKFQYSLSPGALLSTSSRKCNIDWLHRFGNSSPTAAPPIFLLPRKTGRREESKRRPAWHDANGRVIYPVETARKFLFLGASPR